MDLPPLASLEQFAARLATPPEPAAFTRIMTLLGGASSAVRSRCGQAITAGVTTNQRLTIVNGLIRLPQRPVNEITSVVAAHCSECPLLWEFHADDVIKVNPNVPDSWSFEPFVSMVQAARVSYSHGYETVPEELVNVVCNMAGRAYGIDVTQTAYSQEMTGPYQVSVGAAAAQGSLAMLEGERAIVDRYGFRPAVIMTRPL